MFELILIVHMLFQIEATCDPGDFTCYLDTSLLCLLGERKCDGRALCPDQADEKNCGTVKKNPKVTVFLIPNYQIFE